MKNKYILIVFLLVFIASYYFGQLLRSQENSSIELKKMDYDLCDPSLSICVMSYLSYQVKFKFKKKPSALKPFMIYVEISDNDIEDILVDFRMENMDMGMNVIHLSKMASNSWSGEAVLPVCSLGRNDWISRLKIRANNVQWYADFLFQQK